MIHVVTKKCQQWSRENGQQKQTQRLPLCCNYKTRLYNKNVKRCSGESENTELKGISAESIKRELTKNARKVYHKCRTYLMGLTTHWVNRGKFQ